MAYIRALPGLVLAAALAHSLPASAKTDATMLAVAPVGSVLGVAPGGGNPVLAPRPLGPTLSPLGTRRDTTRPAPRADSPSVDPHAVLRPKREARRNLDRELRRLYRRDQPALRSCFVRAARGGLELEPKLALTLAVDPGGAVRQVAFDSSATPALAECMQRWVGRWRFSPGEQAELALAVLFRGR